MITVPVACVVDASVAVKLVITEPLSSVAHDLFAHLGADPAARFHVPELFYAECANILWKQVQHFGYPPADARLNLATLTALALQTVPLKNLAADALAIATQYAISAYDGCYVAAAQLLSVPLITADQKLVNKLAASPHAVAWLGSLTVPRVP
jgi:predicted nucleic acid-binding protein